MAAHIILGRDQADTPESGGGPRSMPVHMQPGLALARSELAAGYRSSVEPLSLAGCRWQPQLRWGLTTDRERPVNRHRSNRRGAAGRGKIIEKIYDKRDGLAQSRERPPCFVLPI
jgi:hypothetical protein